MLTYAIKRIGLALLIIVVVMLAMYAMVFLVPGDPASLALGPRATPELKQELMVRMGLDQPIYVQVWNFFRNALTGDLGYIRYNYLGGPSDYFQDFNEFGLVLGYDFGVAQIQGAVWTAPLGRDSKTPDSRVVIIEGSPWQVGQGNALAGAARSPQVAQRRPRPAGWKHSAKPRTPPAVGSRGQSAGVACCRSRR